MRALQNKGGRAARAARRTTSTRPLGRRRAEVWSAIAPDATNGDAHEGARAG